ncbi:MULTISPECIES: suppressor of fused domain protein [unclassified Nocardiopsis]|uniref:suppressor of fused domain protein n=1 Tax=unclassified Nocardiopsis TaxID=2649073 RepID=UPI001357C807|nr:MULTISPECIES: suppressor of fused domain protein [unclassified Nocardiopsis]
MTTGRDARLRALEEHVREFWSGHPVEALDGEYGPVRDRLPGFTVHRVAPRGTDPAWVYVTAGASLPEEAGGAEFLLMSPVAEEGHAETLATVSRLHSFEEHRLDVGSLLDLGRPWMPGSPMDHLLVCPPHPYGPGLEWAPAGAGRARFLWLLPLHRGEADFLAAESLDAFEEILEAEGIDVLDLGRAPLV